MTDGWKPCLVAPGTVERKGRKAIYRTDTGHYVIADGDVWLPGIFADRATAIAAFRYDARTLQSVQDAMNDREPDFTRRVISTADLEEHDAARTDRE
ncbi:hypothetical protein [Prosthecomicrobium hirschii]|uniref:hypothetical protein n=1 Tax=Prosthecodimorpha hirschii TaxID=665126 RepID=UPI002220F1E0|nr:hypothetical protein [Prosthecomicrobium hirschii]MCW1844201.1 hypothetical protein [Prosthecomicrobium hirschii]